MRHANIAVEGDLCDCPLEGHRKTKIIICREDEAFTGVATIGDKAECGCEIIEGSTHVEV